MMIATPSPRPPIFPRRQAARALDGAGVGRLRHGQRHRPGSAARQPRRWVGAPPISPIAAAVALFLLARYFPIKPVHTGERRIDWLGALLLVVAVGAPLAALELGFASGDHAHPAWRWAWPWRAPPPSPCWFRSNGAWHPRSSLRVLAAANRNC